MTITDKNHIHMEDTKKANESTEKHLFENDAEDTKAFKIDGPKCLMEEDFRKIVDYDRFSWENARNLDERVQKRDKEIDRTEIINRIAMRYLDTKDSPLRTLLDGMIALGKCLSVKVDDTELGLRSQYAEIVRKLRERGIEPKDIEVD